MRHDLDGARTKNNVYVILVSAKTCRASMFKKSLATRSTVRYLKGPIYDSLL